MGRGPLVDVLFARFVISKMRGAFSGLAGSCSHFGVIGRRLGRELPDQGHRLAAGGGPRPLAGGVVRLLGVGSGYVLRCLKGHAGVVTDLVFSTPGGELLASSSTDGSCRVWNVGTGQLVTALVRTHGCHLRLCRVCSP